MIRVGLDLTALERNTTGAGEYQRNLVKAFDDLSSELEIIIYLPQDIDIPHLKHIQMRKVSWQAGDRYRRIVLSQFLLAKLGERDHLDILHVPFFYLPFRILPKTIMTAYDLRFIHYPETYTFGRRLFLQCVVPWSVRRATHIVAISEHTRRDLTSYTGVSPNKISVVHLGARLGFKTNLDFSDLSRVREKYSLPESFILCVSTIEPRKNLVRLIQAFFAVQHKNLPHELVIAGAEYLHGHVLRQAIHRLDIEKRVRLLGFIPDSDLPALYSMADLFVYPSLYEGFGIPILEAMACGVPVVASNVSSIPEVVDSAGYLVDPYNVEQMADAILHLLQDRNEHQRLREAGLARSEEFSWSRTARETLGVYKCCLLT